ncbi:MAG: Mfa1 fimbrilin C-terminal domain-containing protein [Muribaculaceae bacterium]|nr:Mfa1 fimbrilin C-terminal domain-containing protein [Muribaculaceae bacterium]
MRFKYILIAFVAFLISCSSESEKEKDIQNNLTAGSGNGYLCINIVVPTVGTRDGFYVGSANENRIDNLRFYFFDKDLKAQAINAVGATHIDVGSADLSNNYSSGNAGNTSNIESTVTTLLEIESSIVTNSCPSYIAVVANIGSSAPSLSAGTHISLLQNAGDYSSQEAFVMSSSVYKGKKTIYNESSQSSSTESTDSEIIAVYIRDNIKQTEEEAQNSPASIYLERVLAKVSGNIAITTADGVPVSPQQVTYNNETFDIYKLSSEKIDQGGSSGTDIYVRLIGWNVTAKAKTARLVKKINTRWDEKFSGWSVDWNDPTNFRSYWAINPSIDKIDGNFTFQNYNDAKQYRFDSNNGNINYTYLLENAGRNEAGISEELVSSKVIGAAQLVNSSGTPLTLAQWGGEIYNFNDNDTKTALMNTWASYTKIYKQTGNTWTSITGSDLKLVASSPGNPDNAYTADSSPRYYAKVALKNDGSERYYAILKMGIGEDGVLDKGENDMGYRDNAPEIKAALDLVGLIKYWESGQTYYWFDIPHMGSDVESAGTVVAGTGKYGVVRNNWYNFTVNAINGLGVPVADGNTVIYPENPNDPEESYLGIKIEILPWRYVEQPGVTLGK